MRRIVVAWSGGKDSAWVLHQLRSERDLHVVALVTSFEQASGRVATHAVRRCLIEAQAMQAGLPLWAVDLPSPCSNQDYDRLMGTIWKRAVSDGVTEAAFGDLFLQDIRDYRQRQLRETGLVPVFPLWQRATDALAEEMIEAGLRAKVTCVDSAKLDRSFAGRDFDRTLLASLPAEVDPCGENGEFHTFVHASPEFSAPISVEVGAITVRSGMILADVLPRSEPGASVSQAGLCDSCEHKRIVVSDQGSRFYRCMLSDKDARFPRYPRLPVLSCAGYSRPSA